MASLHILKWRNGNSVQQFCPFPVGGVYISASNVSPASIWPGTSWTRIAAGTFLVSSGGATTGDYAVGKTGGSSSVTLTVDQMPSHGHSVVWGDNGSDPLWALSLKWNVSLQTVSDPARSIAKTGGGKAHENRPPYLSVDMWRRTA